MSFFRPKTKWIITFIVLDLLFIGLIFLLRSYVGSKHPLIYIPGLISVLGASLLSGYLFVILVAVIVRTIKEETHQQTSKKKIKLNTWWKRGLALGIFNTGIIGISTLQLGLLGLFIIPFQSLNAFPISITGFFISLGEQSMPLYTLLFITLTITIPTLLGLGLDSIAKRLQERPRTRKTAIITIIISYFVIGIILAIIILFSVVLPHIFSDMHLFM